MSNQADCATPRATPKFDEDQCRKHLRLLHQDAGCFEIRLLGNPLSDDKKYKFSESYFFDEIEEAIEVCRSNCGRRTVTTNLNPILPIKKEQVPLGQLIKGSYGTKDDEISGISWLLIDLDPKRPKNTAANKVERSHARVLANTICEWLRSKRISHYFASSGNGYHLYLPLKNGSSQIAKNALQVLNRKFENDHVEVDQTTHNPSRVVKVWGTAAIKGQNSAERPWRIAKSISRSSSVVPCDLQTSLEEEMVSTDTKAFIQGDAGQTLLQCFQSAKMYSSQKGNVHFVVCPWGDTHTTGSAGDGSTVLITEPLGREGFKCHHSHCSDKRTADVKAYFESRGFGRFGRTHQSSVTIETNLARYTKPEPKEVGREAFAGLVGETLDAFAPNTEASKVALLIQLLTILGNIIGRMRFVSVESSRHYPNLFSVVIGDSAKARKGTSLNWIKKLFEPVDEVWFRERIINGLTSGEGIIHAIRDPVMVSKEVKDPETGAKTVEMVMSDMGVKDKRALVIASEYASVLRQIKKDGNILSPVLRSAWDGDTLQLPNKNSPTKCTDPHVSIVGHITIQEFKQCVSDIEIMNGFINRCLLVYSKRSQQLPFGGGVDDEVFSEFAEKWRGVVDYAVENSGPVNLSQKAKSLWCAVYPYLSEAKPGLFGHSVARAEAQVLRLALTYSIAAKKDRIEAAHLKSALAVWTYCEQTNYFIFGDRSDDPTKEELFDLIATNADGVSRTTIRDHFGRNRSKGFVDKLLAGLVSEKRIKSVKQKTAGRYSEVWFPAYDKNDQSTQLPDYVLIANQAENANQSEEPKSQRDAKTRESGTKSTTSPAPNKAGQISVNRDKIPKPEILH